MITSNPDKNSPGANRPQSPPAVRYDLAAMLKANPHVCRVLKITRADTDWLKLTLQAAASFDFTSSRIFACIECVEAVDFSVRPASPTLLGGGPFMEFHEQHPLLRDVSQCVPNTDGMEIYDPPVKFGVLILDQTYVIAGQFAVRLECGKISGLDEQQRQRHEAGFQRMLEWMEPFRLTQLKTFFKTRPLWTER